MDVGTNVSRRRRRRSLQFVFSLLSRSLGAGLCSESYVKKISPARALRSGLLQGRRPGSRSVFHPSPSVFEHTPPHAGRGPDDSASLMDQPYQSRIDWHCQYRFCPGTAGQVPTRLTIRSTSFWVHGFTGHRCFWQLDRN